MMEAKRPYPPNVPVPSPPLLRVANIWGWIPVDQDPFNDYWGIVRQELQYGSSDRRFWYPLPIVDIDKEKQNAN
jgi:hypothetical protein